MIGVDGRLSPPKVESAPKVARGLGCARPLRAPHPVVRPPIEWGHELSPDDPLDNWLGAKWGEVPPHLRGAVVTHIFGVDLVTMATYAAGKARHVLERVDPDMRSDFEDVAQDAMVELTATLPAERIRHWKTHVLQQLQWQALQSRRRRTAEKRHPGSRVDYDAAVLTMEDRATSEQDTRLADRSILLAALAGIEHQETAAVLRATFVLAADGSFADVQTTKEVADALDLHQAKVKRLRAAGAKLLREALVRELAAREDTDDEEAS
ncbi:hypothetical protein ACIGO9_19855 [Nocardia asteroides]|uniref:hypothetical protein n=1 Tax=Nocardia asteroides TaxID=1824 RepID=UPI0037C67075